jgi:hypothetical protein
VHARSSDDVVTAALMNAVRAFGRVDSNSFFDTISRDSDMTNHRIPREELRKQVQPIAL